MLKRYILLLICTAGLVGCIENNIPYPTILGSVDKMAFAGQTEDPKVDATKRTVSVTLSDTVDLRAVHVDIMRITKDATCTIDSGSTIDLTLGVDKKIYPSGYGVGEPYKFTISTFQSYEWTILATQTIKREIEMSGSIGSALIDDQNYVAVVNVDKSQILTDMVVDKFVLGPSNATYSPNPFPISNFSSPVKIDVSYFGITEQWTVVVKYSEVNVSTGKTPNAWGMFAYVSGVVNPKSAATSGFDYRPSAATDWLAVDAVRDGSKISAKITGLQPNTEYVVRARLGEEYGEQVTFKTETTPSIPNLDFEYSYATQPKNIWFFNESAEAYPFWATGNQGVAIINRPSNTMPVKGAESKTGTAVRMETVGGIPVAGIAAGNLFTGIYINVPVPPMNIPAMKKLVVFGRPYSGRPTRLTGWYKYTPKNVDVIKDPQYENTKGKPDFANIYIRLEKWPDGWEDSNPGERPADDQVTRVASGDFRTDKQVDSYAQFTIDLTYETLTEKPNHVVLVATSSVNGGDFCGGVGSVLYIDDFALSFD